MLAPRDPVVELTDLDVRAAARAQREGKRRAMFDYMYQHHGLYLRTTARDGNCLYRAIMLGVFNDSSEQAVTALRVLIAHQVRVDTGLRARLNLEEVSELDDWLCETLTDGTYGSHAHLVVAEEVLDLPIRLFVVQGARVTLAVDDAGNYKAIPNRPVQHILFDGDDHYSGLSSLVQPPFLVSWTRALADWRNVTGDSMDYPTLSFDRARPHEQRSGPVGVECAMSVQSARAYVESAVTAAFPALHPPPASFELRRLMGGRPSAASVQPVPSLAAAPPVSAQPTEGRPFTRAPPAACSADHVRGAPAHSLAPSALPPSPALHHTASLSDVSVDPRDVSVDVPGLVWPLQERHWENFTLEQGMDGPIDPVRASCSLVRHAPLVPDTVLLAAGLPSSPPAMASWETLPSFELAAYQVSARLTDGSLLVRFLRAVRHAAPYPFQWPRFTTLRGAVPWFIRYRPPPPLTPAVTQSSDHGGSGCILDSFGAVFSTSRSQFATNINRVEPVAVLAKRDRVLQLCATKGNHAQNVCVLHLVPAAHELYCVEQLRLNPHNTRPSPPTLTLYWYSIMTVEDLGFMVFCFEFPSPHSVTPGLSLVHFLPTAIAASLHAGTLTYDHCLLALSGIGATYGVLYNPAYEIELEATVSAIRRLRLGEFFAAAYIESAILNCLHRMYRRTLPAERNTPFYADGDDRLWEPLLMSAEQWAGVIARSLLHVMRHLSDEGENAFRRISTRAPTPSPIGTKAPPQPRPPSALPPTMSPDSMPSRAAHAASPFSAAKPLCVADLLHHYTGSAPCAAGTSCPSVHYAAIRYYPFPRAETTVRASPYPAPVQRSLLDKMKLDSVKFHSIPSATGPSTKPSGRGPGRRPSPSPHGPSRGAASSAPRPSAPSKDANDAKAAK